MDEENEPPTVIETLPDALDYIEVLKGVIYNELKPYILKLEYNLKRYNKANRELKEANTELARKCKEHFTAAQNLMRYELKIPDDYDEAKATKETRGEISGSGVKFKIGPE